jgi:hypothetical protein
VVHALIVLQDKNMATPVYKSLFPLLVTKCPHCLEATKFSLIEQVAYIINILGAGIGRMEEYLIRCDGCGYKEFVRKKDYDKWKNLGDAHSMLRAGSMSQDDFMRYMVELDLPELKALFQSADTWSCPCGETNPPNFASCWKCNSPSPIEPVESLDRPVSTGEWQPWKP